MTKYTIMMVVLLLCVKTITGVQAQPEDKAAVNNIGTPTIAVTKLDINDKALRISYEIRNDSEDDVWILVGIEISRESVMNAEISMAEDDQTLMIRRRLDLPTSYEGAPFDGRYVRLRAGESQTESILTKIPVYPLPQLTQFKHAIRQNQGLEHATRLKIEFGYYPGNLPEIMFKRLEEEEEETRSKQIAKNLKRLNSFRGVVGGVLTLNFWNERLISRDEEFLIPDGYPIFRGEKVLSTVFNNVRIPYIEMQDRTTKRESPNLASCTKVEIQYQPSMLEYFFPFAFQQNLLSSEEMKYLQSEKTLVVENPQQLKAFAHDVGKAKVTEGAFSGYIRDGAIRYRSKVNLVCFYYEDPPISFSIYNDYIIAIEGEWLSCFEGFPSLKMLTPQVQRIHLRTQCAANLKNLWYRLRFYNKAESKRLKNPSFIRETTYPTPTEWCDDMLQPYNPSIDILPLPTISKWDEKTHICPSAGEGKNHYAMNANCKPDSPPATVLLFETKTGWNQQGGPELFTFDNHDPKGGCVLLNDGTVKFNRTKEELHQLRWK